MTGAPIPWRSCTVSIYRYRQIGILWYSARDRCFPSMLDFVRRSGVGPNEDGFRHVYTDDPSGRLRQIGLDEIDWTGLDAALGKAA